MHNLQRQAFTLIELLVVIAIVGILASLLFPTLSKTKQKGQALQCMNNTRQLNLAWVMYADDSQGALVPNGNTVSTGPSERWVDGTMSFTDNNSDNTNLNHLTNSKLGPYCNRNTAIYKCPSDKYTCNENGVEMPRVRSNSMNGFIEGGFYNSEKASKGAPLNGSIWYPEYYSYNKMSDIINPSPADLFVFVDEHPDSINDGWMITNVRDSDQWIDLPASYHGASGGFSFADGHAATHKWLENSTCAPVIKYQLNGLNAPGSRDIAWMRKHASALIE